VSKVSGAELLFVINNNYFLYGPFRLPSRGCDIAHTVSFEHKKDPVKGLLEVVAVE